MEMRGGDIFRQVPPGKVICADVSLSGHPEQPGAGCKPPCRVKLRVRQSCQRINASRWESNSATNEQTIVCYTLK